METAPLLCGYLMQVHLWSLRSHHMGTIVVAGVEPPQQTRCRQKRRTQFVSHPILPTAWLAAFLLLFFFS
jgi:hypothetical protein